MSAIDHTKTADSDEMQHFVNQAHLRAFAIHGKRSLLWEYEKPTGRIRQRSVRKVCARTNYYAFRTRDGQMDNTTVERRLGSTVEHPASPVIANLIPNGHGRIEVEEKEKSLLAVYIGTLLTRGPAFRDGIHELHKSLVRMTLQQLLETKDLPAMPRNLKAGVEKQRLWNTIKAEIDSGVSISPMLSLGTQVAESLLTKAWTFLVAAPGTIFVTSDNPVYFRLPDEIRQVFGPIPVGPTHPLSEITVPLRKDLMLVCHPNLYESEADTVTACGDVITLTEEQTYSANLRPIQAAVRYVYASEKSLIVQRQVIAFRDASQTFINH